MHRCKTFGRRLNLHEIVAILELDYVLAPGRYVGLPDEEDDFDFAEGAMSDIVKTDEYRQWIVSIKKRIQASQIQAAIAVNRELLELYWFMGQQIIERQESAKWGDGFLVQMSDDLLKEFPEMKGFSHRNLKSIRQWFRFWNSALEIGKQPAAQLPPKGKQLVSQTETKQPLPNSPITPIAPQLVSQIPWGHNILIIQKLSDPKDALFNVQGTIENNWSRVAFEGRYCEYARLLRCHVA